MTDLSPSQHLDRFLKARANLNGEDAVFWWKGYIYTYIPGEPSQRILGTEGFNIGRIEAVDGGYQMITREVNFYSDMETGEILEQWHNPLNDKTVDVIQVWNDPVNQQFMENGPHGAFTMPIEDLGNGQTCMYFDVMLAYPSPLPRGEYPLNSQSDLYQGAELFQFFVNKDELEDPNTTDIMCSNSWTRIGPWLPWMEMGDHPGNLVYQCRGSKLADGFEALPQHMQDYVMKHQPKYARSPEAFSTPNETSWTYFKKLKVEQG